MTDDRDVDALAGEYVLGTMAGADRGRFEALIRSDHAAARAVDAWEQRLTPLLGELEPEAPPAGAWDDISRRIAADPHPRMVTVREDEGLWTIIAPGVAKKSLHFDDSGTVESYLIRFDPGARFDAHEHLADEECMMLSGELSFGDLTLRAGVRARVA